MLNNLTDNIKFFIMLMVYVIYLTWWAASMSTTVDQQMIISQKTVKLLDSHIIECNKRKVDDAILRKDIKHLQEDFNNFKIRQHEHYGIMEKDKE